jgi:uncharacterized membrane protein
MKLREDRWLEGRIADWVSLGLIAPAQAEAIRAHESRARPAPRLSFPVLLAGLGALSVALGIILVVSFNWEEIPALFKQLAFLLAVALAGAFTARRADNPGPGQTGAAIGWFLLPLAGIGLWGQVYQLSGDPLKPLLVWLALGAPLVALLRQTPLTFAFAAGIVFTLFVTPWAGPSLLHAGREGFSFAGWLLALGLWAAAFAVVRAWAGEGTRAALAWALLAWVFSIGEGVRAYGGWSEASWPLMLAAVSALAWGLHRSWVRPEEGGEAAWTGILLNSVTLYSVSFLWHERGYARHAETPASAYAWAWLGLGAVLLLVPRLRQGGPARAWALDLAALLSPLIPAGLAVAGATQAAGLSASALLLGWGAFLCWYGIQESAPKLVNMGVFLSGLLLLTRFFDYFDSLLASGLGFIVAGLLVLGLSWALNLGRKRLLDLAKGGAA